MSFLSRTLLEIDTIFFKKGMKHLRMKIWLKTNKRLQRFKVFSIVVTWDFARLSRHFESPCWHLVYCIFILHRVLGSLWRQFGTFIWKLGHLDLSRFECWRKMKLEDHVIRSLRVAKVFRENSDRINYLDFSANGETLITSSDDDSMVIYDCLEGK